jgi:hypothetical protein
MMPVDPHTFVIPGLAEGENPGSTFRHARPRMAPIGSGPRVRRFAAPRGDAMK